MVVSIILTCYRQEKFIEETILSVVNQTYKNRELLIGDDSPDNNCRKIISKYLEKYPDKIKAWHHNPNKGIVNNMQFLLGQKDKKSDYITFLEGDDCLFSEYLEKKLEIFSKHTNIQLVYNELTTIDEKGKVINERELEYNSGIISKKGKISYECLISHIHYMSWSTIMVKSDMVKKYPIYSEFLGKKTILSDIYFFNQIAHNEDIFGIEEPLVYYRIHNDSITKNTQGSIILLLEFINYVQYLFDEGHINKNTYKNQICKRYLNVAIIAIKQPLQIGFFKTLKYFLIECKNAVVYRFRNFIK